MQIYLVGGAVRDRLLGIPSKDNDWVVIGSTPQKMKEKNFKPIGKEFPIFLHPETKEEYALARMEKKTGAGHKNFSFMTSSTVTLEEDLARRDLTINAIAESSTGEMIDPFNGQEDISKGILRHVSPAFVEDPLRVLRVARFSARFNFWIAPETLVLMRAIVKSGELTTLTPERVWNEFARALQEPYPTNFISALRDCNALSVLFPEIDRLFGIPQTAKYHPEIDTGVHTLMALEQAASLSMEPNVRFAVLLHDLGKGTTKKSMLPSHHGHEARGVQLVATLCQRYRVPNHYKDLAIQVAMYHLICHRVETLCARTILKKLESMDALRKPERFHQFLICCEADSRGRKGFTENPYPQAEYFSKMLDAIKNVVIDTNGFHNLDVKIITEKIREKRLAAIKTVIESYQNK